MSLEQWKTLQMKRPLFLFIAFLLVGVNWGMEWKKWQLTLVKANIEESEHIKMKAFLAGIATGLVTPNMLGNFIGRIFYFSRKDRLRITMLTFLSNFAQFFASVFWGLIALLILQRLPFEMDFRPVVIVLVLFVLVALSAYFFHEHFSVGGVKKWKKYQRLLRYLETEKSTRLSFLFWSLLRHAVFSIQFFLLLNAFTDFSWEDVFWIWQVFLWTTLVPSLWFGKLVIRESMALFILGGIGISKPEILFSSVLLWTMNLALPSLLSIFICKGDRV